MKRSIPLSKFRETCALDVADRGEHTLAEIADYLGGPLPLSRERIRQLTNRALAKLMRRARILGWREQIEFPGEAELEHIPGPPF